MSRIKVFVTSFITTLYSQLFAQKTSRDLLVLKDGNTQAGKVIESDSVSLVLLKYDLSKQKYLWSDIDSVKCLSYKTHFFSGAFGFSHVNYWSTFMYKYLNDNSSVFDFRYGRLKWGQWSRYVELTLIPAKPFGVQRLGGGFSYYYPRDYTKKTNIYGGGSAHWTSVDNNAGFISFGVHIGAEYLNKNNQRFFAEIDLQRAIFNVNRNTSFSFLVGIRSGKEFAQFYKKLNQTRSVK
ncbi:MAG: hypothetical protein HYZ42_18685 [Bacteroidetes bacterium]|nr:hypothetical protein [Bacteroidota bacterium]